jgi:hypothetical protein
MKKLERKKHMSQAQKDPKPHPTAREKDTSLPNTVTSEQIALRAYQIYLERGEQPGSDVDDWLEAERQLNQTVQP